MFRVCHAFLSAHCSFVVTCYEMANLLAIFYVMFSCVFVTFPCGFLGQVWCLIVSIPDLRFLTYFHYLMYHQNDQINLTHCDKTKKIALNS